MYSKTIMMGRLTADPELRQTPNQVSVATFTIAVDRDYKRDDKRPTDFFNCVAWRGIGESIARFFHKGKPILVEGHLENRSYEKDDGTKRYVTELIVESFTFTGDKAEQRNNLPEPPPEPHSGQAPEPSGDFAEVGEGSNDLPF